MFLEQGVGLRAGVGHALDLRVRERALDPVGQQVDDRGRRLLEVDRGDLDRRLVDRTREDRVRRVAVAALGAVAVGRVAVGVGQDRGLLGADVGELRVAFAHLADRVDHRQARPVLVVLGAVEEDRRRGVDLELLRFGDHRLQELLPAPLVDAGAERRRVHLVERGDGFVARLPGAVPGVDEVELVGRVEFADARLDDVAPDLLLAVERMQGPVRGLTDDVLDLQVDPRPHRVDHLAHQRLGVGAERAHAHDPEVDLDGVRHRLGLRGFRAPGADNDRSQKRNQNQSFHQLLLARCGSSVSGSRLYVPVDFKSRPTAVLGPGCGSSFGRDRPQKVPRNRPGTARGRREFPLDSIGTLWRR